MIKSKVKYKNIKTDIPSNTHYDRYRFCIWGAARISKRW